MTGQFSNYKQGIFSDSINWSLPEGAKGPALIISRPPHLNKRATWPDMGTVIEGATGKRWVSDGAFSWLPLKPASGEIYTYESEEL